jgi:LysR family transcriptional regulator of gallate degradation
MVHVTRPDEEWNAVSIRQMLLFEAAGRLGTVTEAAAACGLSQPAATQALQQLAERTGLDLFERGTKGLVLNAAGASLHENMARILEQLRRSFGLPVMLDLWRLSPTHLRAFVAMFQRRKVESAAATLGVTARSVLRALQAVEALAGAVLLDEKASGRALSAKGKRLARACELFLNELDWSIAKAVKIQNGSRAILRIGVTTDPGMAAIGNVVKDHLQRHPQSCVQIDQASPPELLTRLVIGQIDMIFGYSDLPLPAGVEWEPLYSSPFRVAAALDHPLAAYPSVSLADLLPYDWVDANEGSQRHVALLALFASDPMPRCRLTSPAPPLLAQVIASSTALGLMTDYELATRRDQLVALACSTQGLEMKIACAHRISWEPSAAQVDLLSRTRQYFAAQSLMA